MPTSHRMCFQHMLCDLCISRHNFGSASHGAADMRGPTLAAQSWRWQAPKRARMHMAAPSPGRPGVAKDDKLTVYVGNLPYAAEEADLVAHFEQAGSVVDVRRGAAPDGAPTTQSSALACPLHVCFYWVGGRCRAP